MLARLSSADYPALAGLKTRDDDDFSIALLDASSVMLDILTFYQERLANESYLRTATQLQSLTELARLIGYQPAPGVGSSVYLSFTLAGRAGLAHRSDHHRDHHPEGNAGAERARAGTDAADLRDLRRHSRQGGLECAAGADGRPWMPQMDDISVYLQGTATQLQPGDAILIVGDERLRHGQRHQSELGYSHRHCGAGRHRRRIAPR